jgi:hypothetical protein
MSLRIFQRSANIRLQELMLEIDALAVLDSMPGPLVFLRSSPSIQVDGINTANIISGSRYRRPRQDPDYAAYLTMEDCI